jgi:DNA-binding NarL/FixJ family response regulator
VAKQFILVVEDDPTWQDIFTEIIGDVGFNPLVVSSYQDAVAALAARSYVLAVVDISLSLPDYADRGGVEVLKEMVKLSVRLPAIVVTGYATVDLAIETLVELNAVHFFRKEAFDRPEFRRVLKKEAGRQGALHALSKREHEVLLLMSRGQTNKQMAESLVVSVNTVKKHVQNIFTKLNVETRAAAVAKALEPDG